MMAGADLDTRIRAWSLHALASHALDNPDQAAARRARQLQLLRS
jgi:hypothetical protein